MGSTNYTPELGLPLFSDGDKPTWRGDVNDAHNKIDDHANFTRTTLSNIEDTANQSSADIAAIRSDMTSLLPRSEYTDSNILAMVKRVDGAGSGLDADSVDGVQASEFARVADAATKADVSNVKQVVYDERLVGPRKNCVIVGSSNAVSGTWTNEFCAALGLTMRNFAVGGGAYSTNDFQNQLRSAANDNSFSNESVGMVIIADASNDIRAKVTVQGYSAGVYNYARNTFPNARVIVLPVIWPSDAQTFVFGVPGGYQIEWHEWLSKNVDTMRNDARNAWCEFVEDSWTWLTGHDEWMQGTEVHPNAAGFSVIAKNLIRWLAGHDVVGRGPWVRATLRNNVVHNDYAQFLSTKREGWKVFINGAVKPTNGASFGVDGAGNGTDVATVAKGYRPTYPVHLVGRNHETNESVGVIIWPDGTVRVQGSVGTNQSLMISAYYDIG